MNAEKHGSEKTNGRFLVWFLVWRRPRLPLRCRTNRFVRSANWWLPERQAITFDAGGLVALDRNDRRAIVLLAREEELRLPLSCGYSAGPGHP
jgi:hypothetical protein